MGKRDPLMQQARRDYRVAIAPERNAIRRARRQGRQDYRNAQARVSQVTGALLNQLSQIPGAYSEQTAGIIPNVQQAIGGLGSMLGTNLGAVPDAERAAGTGLVGTIGAGAIERIASQQQNMADYLASGAQQGAVQGAVLSRNYLHDYQNFLKDNTQQMVDLHKQAKDAILQRLDQLRQEKFDRTIALRQLGMQQAQIDQANRSLDAQIWYMQQQADRALAADRRRRNQQNNQEDTTTPTGTGGGGGGLGGLPGTSGGGVGGQGAAMNPGGGPVQLPDNATPEVAMTWVRWQPMRTAAEQARVARQLVKWANSNQLHMKIGQDNRIVADPSFSRMPGFNPDVERVIDQFNASIGG